MGGRFLTVFEEVSVKFSECDYTGAGYYGLYVGVVDGKYKRERLHRIVASVFLGDRSGEWEVDHIDGDRKNNKLSNLRWVTHSENMKNAYDRGAFEGCQELKYGEEELMKILELIETGADLVQISKKCGMSREELNRFRLGVPKGKFRKKFILDNLERFKVSAEKNKYKFHTPKTPE